MAYHHTQSVLFPDAFLRPLRMNFSTDHVSSDGGAVLLQLADQRLGLIPAIAACIRDLRQQGKVDHTVEEMLRQRIFGIACGYADCNDAAYLSRDPVMKLLRGDAPESECGLASQPTLSRLENSVTRADLYRMADCLVDVIIAAARRRHGKNSSLITIDLDPTVDEAHGTQQLSFFNGYYDCHCYLPMPGFISFNGDPEMYLFSVLLRPGNVTASVGAIPLLERVLPKLRRAFPKARVRVRLDGAYATPEVLEYLEAPPKVEYLVNMAKNSVLEGLAEPFMKKARRAAKACQGTARIFGEGRYAARSWGKRERRVVIKAEVTVQEDRELRDNPRFVVTNMRHKPEGVYQVYRARAECENRIKELKYGLELDRTSCSRFLANQFRVLLVTAAYALFQEIRYAARGTSLARTQVSGMQLKLLKIGVRVVESARRIVFHAPKAYGWMREFMQIARRLQPRLT